MSTNLPSQRDTTTFSISPINYATISYTTLSTTYPHGIAGFYYNGLAEAATATTAISSSPPSAAASPTSSVDTEDANHDGIADSLERGQRLNETQFWGVVVGCVLFGVVVALGIGWVVISRRSRRRDRKAREVGERQEGLVGKGGGDGFGLAMGKVELIGEGKSRAELGVEGKVGRSELDGVEGTRCELEGERVKVASRRPTSQDDELVELPG